jgi:hypothetical protein
MSAQIVLLPVFVLVGLTFALLLVDARRGSLAGDETRRDITLNQSELPLLFYVLIALAPVCRSFYRAEVLGVHGDVFRPSRNFREIEQRPATLARAARGECWCFSRCRIYPALRILCIDIAASRVIFSPWGPLLSAKELRIIC